MLFFLALKFDEKCIAFFIWLMMLMIFSWGMYIFGQPSMFAHVQATREAVESERCKCQFRSAAWNQRFHLIRSRSVTFFNIHLTISAMNYLYTLRTGERPRFLSTIGMHVTVSRWPKIWESYLFICFFCSLRPSNQIRFRTGTLSRTPPGKGGGWLHPRPPSQLRM